MCSRIIDPYLHVNEGEIGKPVDIHTMRVLFVNLHTYTRAHIHICVHAHMHIYIRT